MTLFVHCECPFITIRLGVVRLNPAGALVSGNLWAPQSCRGTIGRTAPLWVRLYTQPGLVPVIRP